MRVIPTPQSSAIREIRIEDRDDGNYGPVTFMFVNGGGEEHSFVERADLDAVLAAKSVGLAYWRTFRRRYKTPNAIAEPEADLLDALERSLKVGFASCHVCGHPAIPTRDETYAPTWPTVVVHDGACREEFDRQQRENMKGLRITSETVR